MSQPFVRCQNCGMENPGKNKFCGKCGTVLQSPSSQSPTLHPPQQAPLGAGQPAADFVSLSCPTCGGKLQITKDMDRFACRYCGTEYLVRRAGGTISLAPVVAALKKVQTGLDKTASELAIRRLNEEIAQLQRTRDSIQPPGCVNKVSGLLLGFGALGLLFSCIPALGGASGLPNEIYGMIVGYTLMIVASFVIIGIVQSIIDGQRAPYQNQIEVKMQEIVKHKRIIES